MITYEIFQTSIQKIVAAVGEDFKHPEQDWHPVLALITEEGFKFIEFDTRFVAEGNKPVLWDNIEKHIAEENAKFAAFICSAWKREIPPEDFDVEKTQLKAPLETYDITSEIVEVVTSDGNDVKGFIAEVERHSDKGPTLKAWESHDVSLGDIPTALKRGFSKRNTSN